jgi:hypothetical protein
MDLLSASAVGSDAGELTRRCIDQLRDGGVLEPRYVMVQAEASLDLVQIAAELRLAWPGVAMHIATSCLGSFTEAGLVMGPEPGLCMLAIADPNGDYGAAAGTLGATPRESATSIVRAALLDADRIGETPDLVWISASPGNEELVLAGIHDVVGSAVPIVGGSAADNTIAGGWRINAGGDTFDDGLVVSVMFTSGRVGAAFHAGYAPTEPRGTVTKCEKRRVYEIDGRPAAAVYSEWTDGAVALPTSGVVNVLADSALYPLGRAIESVGGADVFLLSHPETMDSDGSMTLFTDVEAGDVLVAMRGTHDALIRRPLLVTQSACRVGEIEPEAVRGMILVFCAGCMLAVQERMEEVRASLAGALPGVAILAAFTFGEQGPAITGRNRHGNLMISSVVFAG